MSQLTRFLKTFFNHLDDKDDVLPEESSAVKVVKESEQSEDSSDTYPIWAAVDRVHSSNQCSYTIYYSPSKDEYTIEMLGKWPKYTDTYPVMVIEFNKLMTKQKPTT